MKPDLALLHRYNVPVPRYTSYPTVPSWKEGINPAQWKQVLREQFEKHNDREGISLYLHLPFCESLCTYCGCNKKITTNHGVEEAYLQVLIEEWDQYRAVLGSTPILRELHLGGGTPTFFAPRNLARLLEGIFSKAIIPAMPAFSIEGHPNNTTREHLDTLYALGFRRISYGVQDNDPEVQRLIHRLQPFENVQRATEMARAAGFESVNFDLIYGLPGQHPAGMKKTIPECIGLRPNRVAFYSYAHVPWTSRGQRLFDEKDLPAAPLKMELYRLGKELFTANGYHDIGMDHFALPDDELFKAWQEGSLHRNFMGYTTRRTGILLGLGVSSISDAGVAFAQNHKTLHDYYQAIRSGGPAVTKGYFLNAEDLAFRKYILDTSCRGSTRFRPEDGPLLRQWSFPELRRLAADGLVDWDEKGITVTPSGRHFIRNICKAFDLHLLRNQVDEGRQVFSKAI